METRKATLKDLPQLSLLFNAYRQFYKQASDVDGAYAFLEERLLNKESVVFIAVRDNAPAGFVQLYPVFSSVSMQRLWLLNDLYVDAAFRRLGVGEQLLDAAKSFAHSNRAKGIVLETQDDNTTAQRLYERTGFTREDGFFHYFWKA